MNIHCSHSRELTLIGESIVGETSRSLDLLNDIEETIFAVTWITDKMSANVKFALDAIGYFKESKQDAICDTSGSISEALQSAQNKLLELYNVFIAKRQAARIDHHLIGDDSVEVCYTQAIAVVADLHNSLNDLRWEIYEHDAEFEKSDTGHVFTNAEELDAFLSKL